MSFQSDNRKFRKLPEIGSILCRVAFAAYNSIFFILGISMMTLSVLFIADRTTARQLLSTFIEDDQLVDMIILIGTRIASMGLVLGLILAVIAGFGCFGTIHSNAGLLSAYIAAVGIISIVTFSIIIAIAVNKNKVLKKTYDHLFVKLSSGYDGKHTGETTATLLIDAIQIQFDCCGIFSAADFDSASTWTERSYEDSEANKSYTNLKYPATCCRWDPDSEKIFTAPLKFLDLDTCLRHSSGETIDDADSLRAASNHSNDCKTKIQKYMNSKLDIVFVIVSILLVIEFASIFSAYVFKRESIDGQDY